jgi:predicted RNase H-like HicB family nuclease
MALSTQRQFHVVIEKGEDGYYVASAVELPGCHTQAKTLRELDKRIKEAIELYLDAEGANVSIPQFIAVKKVKV